MNDKTIDLSVSNYGTVAPLTYDIAILPWGATEPHNRHLPYLTDAILSHDIAVDTARLAAERHGIRAMVLPPVAMGAQNPGQRDLAFCIHYRHDTQRAILTDTAASLLNQGIKRLLIVNGHGGNSFKDMIRDLAVDMPDMLIAAGEWYRAAKAADYFDAPGDHADELETSVMLHYHPELVDMELAGPGRAGGFRGAALAAGTVWVPRHWNKVTRDTGIGDPRPATADKGARFAAACAAALAQAVADLCDPDGLYLPIPE